MNTILAAVLIASAVAVPLMIGLFQLHRPKHDRPALTWDQLFAPREPFIMGRTR